MNEPLEKATPVTERRTDELLVVRGPGGPGAART